MPRRLLPPRHRDESWLTYADRVTDAFFPDGWGEVEYARVGVLLCLVGLLLLGLQGGG